MITALEASKFSKIPETNEEKFADFLERNEKFLETEIRNCSLIRKEKRFIFAYSPVEDVASKYNRKNTHYSYILSSKEQTSLLKEYLETLGYICTIKNSDTWIIFTISWK